jgi:hypothetical protein
MFNNNCSRENGFSIAVEGYIISDFEKADYVCADVVE